MKLNRILFSAAALLLLYSSVFAGAASPKASPEDVNANKREEISLEGEKRFRANCGRCHQAPHKLSPAMMRTTIRHMRVRANITDEDMRVILEYITQ
jgi:mono/diheme cytochrome c family protein